MFLVLPPHPFARKRRSHMKVFVAGATGAIGKRLVPQLVASGYEVVAMTRSPKNVEHAVGSAHGIEGVALRYGNLYGPGTGVAADGEIVATVRKGGFPIVGDG